MSDTQTALAALAIYAVALLWPWVLWLAVVTHFSLAAKKARQRDDERIARQDRWLGDIDTGHPDAPVDHYARAVAELALAMARKREWTPASDSIVTLFAWIVGGAIGAYHRSGWSVGLLQ